jgi:hypothetical protein
VHRQIVATAYRGQSFSVTTTITKVFADARNGPILMPLALTATPPAYSGAGGPSALFCYRRLLQAERSTGESGRRFTQSLLMFAGTFVVAELLATTCC